MLRAGDSYAVIPYNVTFNEQPNTLLQQAVPSIAVVASA